MAHVARTRRLITHKVLGCGGHARFVQVCTWEIDSDFLRDGSEAQTDVPFFVGYVRSNCSTSPKRP